MPKSWSNKDERQYQHVLENERSFADQKAIKNDAKRVDIGCSGNRRTLFRDGAPEWARRPAQSAARLCRDIGRAAPDE